MWRYVQNFTYIFVLLPNGGFCNAFVTYEAEQHRACDWIILFLNVWQLKTWFCAHLLFLNNITNLVQNTKKTKTLIAVILIIMLFWNRISIWNKTKHMHCFVMQPLQSRRYEPRIMPNSISRPPTPYFCLLYSFFFFNTITLCALCRIQVYCTVGNMLTILCCVSLSSIGFGSFPVTQHIYYNLYRGLGVGEGVGGRSL
jgi:hypothetical protein